MGLFTFLSDLFFGTKEEQEAVRKQRQEERRRDWERRQVETHENLRTDIQIGRQRMQETLDTEIRKRRERELEAERQYRELGLRKEEFNTLQRISRKEIRAALKTRDRRRRELKEPFRVRNWLKRPSVIHKPKNEPPKFRPK